ncbi:MAG: TonB-dependent siderophore receptor [Cardiobacteriaceae bacterium]|nr:TonB-dependent siderophore receptor [Cardiobacteriaceae bacterium]
MHPLRLNPISIAVRLILCGSAMTLTAQAATQQETLEAINIQSQGNSSEGSGSYTVPVVNVSTGLPLSAQETPQSVSVITDQQIKDRRLNSIEKVLKNTNGVSTRAIDRGRNAFSSRGFDIDKYQVDGMNVNWAGAWVAGESIGDTAIYDRVEVVRGATGLTTGAGNPSAGVNLVRKHADSHTPHTIIEAGIGQRTDWNATLDHTQPFNSDATVRGRIIANHQGGKTFVDREKSKDNTLYGVLDADITDTTRLSGGISYQQTDKDSAMWGGLPALFDDGSLAHWSRKKNASTNWSYWNSKSRNYFIDGTQKIGDNWDISLKANYRDAEGDSELFYFSGNTVNKADGLGWSPWPGKFHTDAKQSNVQLQANGKFEAWGQQHELTVGVQHNKHHRTSYSASDNTNVAPASNFFTWDGSYAKPTWGNRSLSQDQTDTETALYAATRLRVTDQLSVIAGSRFSNWKSTGESYTKPFSNKPGNVWTPYGGILYDITPEQTVYASYTDIFKPQERRDVNNNLLDPIRGKSYEMGWKGSFMDGNLNAQASVFQTRQDNLAQKTDDKVIGSNPPVDAYRAAKGAKVHGFELETSGKITPEMQISAGYSQWSGKDAEHKALNTTSPRRQLKLFATYDMDRFVPGLTVGGGVNWQSRIYTETSNPATNGKIPYGEGSYALVNLMARYKINDHFSAQLNVDNLFDKTYINQLSFNQYSYGEPRYVSASFRYEF